MAESKNINVLFLASEADPLIKIGGLGDVAGSLPVALRKISPAKLGGKKIDVRLVIPFHAKITKKFDNFQLISSFSVSHPSGDIPARAFLTYIDELPIYLIEGATILADANVYSSNPLHDTRKFIFFSLAALELAKQIGWSVDILHANDWHTALSVFDLKIRRPQDPFFQKTKSILSMHNMPYMGADSSTVMQEYGLAICECPNMPAWARSIPLPIGMYSADQLLTVSPTYAREILTPEYGCGLQDFLKTRQESIAGILNGIDEDSWNPATDPALPFNFSPNDVSKRINNKRALQKEFSLNINDDLPLIVLVSRMDQQKGIDIAIEGLRQVSEVEFQAILLGTGDPIIEAACRSLEVEFPERIRSLIRFDTDLSRRIYAGGDIILIPSRYEPCGLTQMIGMHYGCLPLARATGGLQDTIIDEKDNPRNNGFLFTSPTPTAFSEALRRSINLYADKARWMKMQLNGMQTNFSWGKSALEYAKTYLGLIGAEK